jgi:spore germination protein YaaH
MPPQRQLKLLTVIVLVLIISLVKAKKGVMPWMCLERCNDTSSDIQNQLKQIYDHRHELSAVAFELFNLGPNSQLITNHFTRVDNIIAEWGLETYAMVSSYPYPPEFIQWMRQLFNNPEPFIATALQQAQKYGFTGYNVDFEPTVNGTLQDAKNYVIFLSKFADALHQIGKKLTVCIASWNAVWDWKGIGTSGVDKVMVMSTYVVKWDLWQKFFLQAVNEIPLKVLGIGLQSDVRPPLTNEQLSQRFKMLKQYNVQEIDIWRTGIPQIWWPFIAEFVHN